MAKKIKGSMRKVAEYYKDQKWCTECGRTDLPLHLAHIINRSQQGADTIENVRPLCIKCHLEGDHGIPIKSYIGKKL